jgi:hypothetical protein
MCDVASGGSRLVERDSTVLDRADLSKPVPQIASHRRGFAPCRRVGRTMGGVCVTLGEKALAARQTRRFFIVWRPLSGHLFFNHAAVKSLGQ